MKTLRLLLLFLTCSGALPAIGSITQQAYIKTSTGGSRFQAFGIAVAISGDTAVVGCRGAPGASVDTGAVYIFVRSSAGTWMQQGYVTASNAGSFDRFGESVAISGDTLVVGAPRESSNATGVNAPAGCTPGTQGDDSASYAGAAYVFTRNSAGVWTQEAYLKASNTGGGPASLDPGDEFGTSVAVSGHTIVVGAPNEDSSATGVNANQADNSALDAGAAYVFARSGTTWTQQAYLKASNTGTGDRFGISVAVSGNTVVAGASGEGSNAAVVNGNQANNLAPGSGAAYVFTRSGATWTQQAYLKASNSGMNDVFGRSVSVSDDTVIVGAPGEDSIATGMNGNQADNSVTESGAAYVFTRSGTAWAQQAYLKASNTGASDGFGGFVGVSGDAIVVSAESEDSNATGVNGNQADNSAASSGAAYVFTRGGTTWSQLAYLKASNTEADDRFGAAVAISGSTVIAGASGEDSGAAGVNAPVSGTNGTQADNSESASGAAYTFNVPPGDAGGLNTAVTGTYVLAMAVQPDGKAIPGGLFSSMLGTARSNMARLRTDGTMDPFFDPNVNNQVFSLAVQPDGKTIYGGIFTATQGQTRNRLARLNSSDVLETSFNPDMNNDVDCIVLQPDGKILVSGAFTMVGTTTRNRLARLNADGSLDTGFNPNVNERVYSIALQTDGKIVLGGKFTAVGVTTRNRIARVNADGSLDNGFDPNLNNEVYTVMTQPDGKVLIGGQFSAAGVTTRQGLARVNADGALDAGFNPGVPGRVFSLALQADGKILCAGDFVMAGGAGRNYLARYTSTGALDAGFNPNPNSLAYGVTLHADGRILLGGFFTSVGGIARNYFARLANDYAPQSLNVESRTRVTWTRGGSAPEVSQVTLELSVDGGGSWGSFGTGVRIGTTSNWQFTGISLPNSGQIRARGRTTGGYLNASSGIVEQATAYTLSSNATLSALVPSARPLAPAFTPLTTGYTASLNFSNSSITVTPTAADATAAIQVRVNGGSYASVISGTPSASLPLNPGSNTIEILVTAQDGTTKLYTIASTRRAVVIAGEPDALNPIVDGPVFATATQPDGKVLIGGGFSSVQGVARNKLARLNADGTLDTGFNPALAGWIFGVQCVMIQADGKILVSGDNQVVRLNADGTADPGFSLINFGLSNYGAYAMTGDTAGKILIGGRFSSVRGVTRNSMARLNADGSLDTGFNPNVPVYPGATGSPERALVTCFAVRPDGKILIGGRFGNSGEARANLARLNDDGTFDTGFNPATDDAVNCLAIQADGRIIAGGNFTTINGQSRNLMARLMTDGTLDAGFNPNVQTDPCDYYSYADSVQSVALQADGKILLGGYFATVSGQPRNRLARLLANGTLDTGFNPNVEGNRLYWAGEVASVAMLADGKITIGGSFNTVGGLTRESFARLSNDAATQTISFAGVNGILWTRDGTAPELTQVTFEKSTNGGASWIPLGTGTRAGSTASWQITGINLGGGSAQIRARGRTSGGQMNGSSGLVEQIASYAGSSNADLSALIISAGALAPAFAPATTAYNTTVNSGTASLTLSPAAADASATLQVRINGGSYVSVTSGGTTAPLPLDTGSNTIHILVTAPNGAATKLYALTVNRNSSTAPGEVDFLNPAISGFTVMAMAVDPADRTLLAGNFLSIDGTPRSYIARLWANGALDPSFNPQAGNEVYTVAVQPDGKIIFGGSFVTVGGQSRSRLARVNDDGSLDPGFDPAPNDWVLAVVPDGNGKILLGGNFTAVQGQPRPYLARLLADGTLDSSFAPAIGGLVNSLAVQPDGKILVGGQFTSAGGQTRNNIARLHPGGTLDTGFDPNADGMVGCINVLSDGKILLGGFFGAVGGQPRPYLARVLPSGAPDNTFQPGPNGYVTSAAVQSDGKIIFSGSFTTVAGQTRNHVARLNLNGSLDTGFAPNADETVLSVALQDNGKVLLGGVFSFVNGTPRHLFARISNDSTVRQLSAPDATRLYWLRAGSAPDFTQVTFERYRDNGTAWEFLGQASRVDTSSSWQLTGLNLSGGGMIRARGRTGTGYLNGGAGLVEQQQTYSFLSGYSLWSTSNIPPGRDNSFTGDWNGDGFSNGVTYVFGIEPGTFTGSGRISVPPSSPADVDIYLDRTTTLTNVNWSPVVSWVNGAAPVFAGGVSLESGTVRDTFAGSRAFYRYRVVLR